MKNSTRAFQIAFLALLMITFAQAGWWIYEETQFTGAVRDRQVQLYEVDAQAGRLMLDAGISAEQIEQHFPHVAVTDAGVEVRAEAVQALAVARRSRINRYGWEGTFFLVVLLSAMGVILKALGLSNQLMRRQQNFLASASHELKSPLASLRLSAETLILRRPDEATMVKLSERIVRDADRLELLVSNLFATDRLEEGKVELSPATQPVDQLVNAAIEELDAELAGIEVSSELPGDLTVHADAEAFRTCLRNLLTNAAKAVSAGDGASIKVAARAAGASTEVSVADDGVGFEPDEGARLFEKFYRPGDELRRRTKGTGLGLYIVRHFARLSGAEVRCHSDGPGRGAEFTLRWPAGKVSP